MTKDALKGFETLQLAKLSAAIIIQLAYIEGMVDIAQDWVDDPIALQEVLQKALLPPK